MKGEFDRKQATKSLATTLNKLIDKLDNAAENKGEETESVESNEVMTQGSKESASKAPMGRCIQHLLVIYSLCL